MKKSLVFFLTGIVCFFFNVSPVDAQSIHWAKKGISPGFENGNAIVADDSGNVYVTGQIEYTTVFDNYSLASYGIHDIVVAKYDSNGGIKWIRRAGGNGGDIGLGIGIDAQHNVYVTGEIEDKAWFSSSITLTASGGNDVFIAKYDANGNVLWAKKFGSSSSSDKGRAIAVSPSGNSYITGSFYSSFTIGSTFLRSSGGSDIFVVKYDTHGNVGWAKKAGGSREDRGYGIVIDTSENVYVTGAFSSSATFRSTTITNSGEMSSFLAKYSSSGSFQWVKAGGTCCDKTQANAIALDNSGNIYLAGSFGDKTKFSSVTLNSFGLTDIFITKYSPSGNVEWAKNAGGTKEDIAYGIAINNINNHVYLTGFVASAGSAGSISYPFVGYKDVIVAAFNNNSGTEEWIKTYGGNKRDIGLAIAVNSQGNIYTTGLFNGTAFFESITLTGYPNQLKADFFVNKIFPPVTPYHFRQIISDNTQPIPSTKQYITGEHVIEFLQPVVNVFPNPFKDNFTISTTVPVSIRIYDLPGNLIDKKENVCGDITVGENFPRGIYYVEVFDGISKNRVAVIKSK